jgi:hypothetical protein
VNSPDKQCLMRIRMIKTDQRSLLKFHSRLPWDHHRLDHVSDDVLVGAALATESGTFVVIDRPKFVVFDMENF